MTLTEGLVLVGAVVLAALIGWRSCDRESQSDPCVGCGHCREGGRCVLTGKAVDPKKAKDRHPPQAETDPRK